jgi:hypothetical protein
MEHMIVDIEKLIGEVAARNGIRIEPDDPAFALVTLNQLVLEQTVEHLVGQIRAAAGDFESAAERAQSRAGAALARGVAARSAQLRASEGNGNPSSRSSTIAWLCGGALFALLLILIGFGHLVWPCR